MSGKQTDVHEHFLPIKLTEKPTAPKTVDLTAVPESKFILFLAPRGFLPGTLFQQLQLEKKKNSKFQISDWFAMNGHTSVNGFLNG